jgi:hypothetical protein
MAAFISGWAKERETTRLKTRVNAALIGRLEREERKGKAVGRGGICGGAGPGEEEEGKKKGRRRRETDRWDWLVSERKRKEKGAGGVGCYGGKIGGLLGRRAERVRR